MSYNQYCLCIKPNLATTGTISALTGSAIEPTSFPGSLILPPFFGRTHAPGGGKMRDPGYEVALELPLLPLGPVYTNPFANENGAVLLRIRLSSTLQRRK